MQSFHWRRLFRSGLLRRRAFCRAAFLVFAVSSPCFSPHLPAQSGVSSPGDLNPDHIPLYGPIHIQAQNVSFEVMDGVRVNVKSMDGLLLATHAGKPVSLDVPASMRVQIQSAYASISTDALTRLLDQYTLPHSKTDASDIAVTFEDGEVHIAGKIKRLVEIPFSAIGTVDVTRNGDVRVHLTRITAAGFIHKKMLDFLGLNAASVAGPGKPHSFQVVNDDVIFPIHTLFPAPHFTGRLRSIKIVGDDLVQVFGNPHTFAPAPVPAEGYIYFRGGSMQFGRLTMQGVDLELLNKNEGQPLTFSMDHLFAETLPGYLKNRPNHGIVAYISSYPVGSDAE